VVAESVLDELVDAIAAQSAERALGLVHRLIADGQNLQHFCREAIRHFRNLLVTRVCGASSNLIAAPEEERPRLAEQAAQFGEEDLTRFFNILMATDDELRRKPDPRLHLELGLLKLINAQRLAPLEEIVAEMRGGVSEGARAVKPAVPSARAIPAAQPVTSTTAPSVSPFGGPRSTFTSSVAETSGSGAAARMAPESNASVAPATATPPAVADPATTKQSLSGSANNFVAATTAPVREVSALVSPMPVPASPPRVMARVAEDSTNGLLAVQVDAIKAALQGQKFLWSMVEHATRWEIEGGELHLFFPTESRALAEMLQARDPMERLRTVLNQVVGQPLRVCVKLDANSKPVGMGRNSELRSQFEEDPIVRTMLEKFGGQISRVKRPGEE
jgi:DNA polymerase-3 subunit gamma/tau